jgi:pimeloyl-ACP methyl ester carboxylesterase
MALLVDLEAGTMRALAGDEEPRARVYLRRTVELPVPAFREEEVSFRTEDGATLAGTLVQPAAPGPHPAVVFVTGRSNASREAHRTQANLLARFGVAGLIFDSRGTGQSDGDRAALTDRQRFADVRAALDLLSTHSAVDAGQVGLFTHSAGGWVGPVVADQVGTVAFMVINVGPAESLADQQGHVVEYNMRRQDEDFTEADYRAAYSYQKRLVELVNEGAPWEEFEPLVAAAREQAWGAYVDLPEDLQNSELDYFRRRTEFDPVPALKRTTIPVLALYGETDFVVPPAVNVPKMEQYLSEAGNRDFRVVVVPEAGHDMMVGGSVRGEGAWPEAYYEWYGAAPGYYQTIVTWVLEHVRVP